MEMKFPVHQTRRPVLLWKFTRQVLLEDRRTNRIVESRGVFETIVNHKCFGSVAIILFMNKTDLLTEKVSHSDIRQYLAEFDGDPNSVMDVQRFLLDLFESARNDRRRPFFYHFTTAVDTENIRRVFQDCREIILEQNLKSLMMHVAEILISNPRMPTIHQDFLAILF